MEAARAAGEISPTSRLGRVLREVGVRDTTELQRVRFLPRRDWRRGLVSDPEYMARLISDVYRRQGGTMTLRPVQAAALTEAADCGGLLAPMAVGAGKTLVSFLLPAVCRSERPLLLVPAKLRDKTARDWLTLSKHWVLPRVRVESYELIGRVSGAEILANYRPDLIVADECHRLKNGRAAVTRRVSRFLHEAAETGQRCRFVGMSGTITRKSLHDYWHLLRWCLGDAAMPLPKDWREMAEWADAIDARRSNAPRTAPGALSLLTERADETAALRAAAVTDSEAAVTLARQVYQRRLTETPGVVSTGAEQVACSLSIEELTLDLGHLEPYFSRLRAGETPDGWPVADKLEEWRHARELSCGFYMRWNPRPPETWLEARRQWCAFVRGVLSHSQTWDSELQVARAVVTCRTCNRSVDAHRPDAAPHMTPGVCQRFKPQCDPVDEITGTDVHARWLAVRDTFEIHVETVWVDDVTLRACAAWLAEHNGIVWVEHPAFGERLAALTGRPYYGQGGLARDGRNIEDEQGPCIASIRANGEGRNLQRYSRALVASPPPSGATWEQLLGRHHRFGQEADEVSFQVALACREQLEGFHRAIGDARYIQDSTGVSQKLLCADIAVTPETAAPGRGPLWQ